MPEIIDDKSQHCIPFLLERLQVHAQRYRNKGTEPPPFFLGLNGVQGAGKTVLVSPIYYICLPQTSGRLVGPSQLSGHLIYLLPRWT